MITKRVTQLFILIIILFIIPCVSYAELPFDPDNTQFFNPNDTNNIGYYLNNDFYSSLAQKELIEIHSWDIKFEDGSGSQSNVTAKIALISYAEYVTYRSLFPGDGTGYNWWTRTPYSSYFAAVYDVYSTGNLNNHIASYSLGVCPTLYLKSGLMVSSTKKVQETGGTTLHSEAPGTIINFSGVDWMILDQIADGTTYIILNTTTDDITIPPLPPDPPTGLNINNITATSARANWYAVSESTGYIVYWNGNNIANVTDTSYDFIGLQPNTTYNVTVSAVKEVVEGSQCNPVYFTTLANDPEPGDPIWTPLPGPGMGFMVDNASVFDALNLIFGIFKGTMWTFIASFIALFTAGLLWKIWRRAAQ